MNRYFECGIRYEKTLENGMQKKVTELYIVDALSFTEAEQRITKEMGCYISGDFEVVTEKITNYSEVIASDNAEADKWYKVKINIVTIDDKMGKEKKAAVYYLIQAKDIDDARRMTNKHMEGSVLDWDCEAVQETKVMDVFFYTHPNPPERREPDMQQTIEKQSRDGLTSQGFKKAVKDFIDGIPKGQSVTISATGVDESVTIDKRGGGTRIISEPVNNGNKPNGTDEPDTP